MILNLLNPSKYSIRNGSVANLKQRYGRSERQADRLFRRQNPSTGRTRFATPQEALKALEARVKRKAQASDGKKVFQGSAKSPQDAITALTMSVPGHGLRRRGPITASALTLQYIHIKREHGLK